MMPTEALKISGRGISRETGGIWVVYDAHTGDAVAYGIPANHPLACRTAQSMAGRYGREYIATAQPTLAECVAGRNRLMEVRS